MITQGPAKASRIGRSAEITPFHVTLPTPGGARRDRLERSDYRHLIAGKTYMQQLFRKDSLPTKY
jgi:hypothetical protein